MCSPTVSCSVRRVQFTPDLLPSGITGVTVDNGVGQDWCRQDFRVSECVELMRTHRCPGSRLASSVRSSEGRSRMTALPALPFVSRTS
ncbi:MAG: AAA family ATPase [Flavobacterium sp.]|nr:AAA family ATPase [Aeromicrobium sp.]